MYTLYYSPGACSFAVHAVLRELDIPFELRKVEIAKGATRSKAFLEFNPRGRVPVLSNGDWRLTETVAILLFLAGQRPENHLLPKDAIDRAHVLEWLSFFSSTLHPQYWGLWCPHRLTSDKTAYGELKHTSELRMMHQHRNIDAYLAEREFLVGDHLSLADFYLFVFGRWARVLPEQATALPNFRRYLERLSNIESIRTAFSAEGLEPFFEPTVEAASDLAREPVSEPGAIRV